jgi:hypothetical protein
MARVMQSEYLHASNKVTNVYYPKRRLDMLSRRLMQGFFCVILVIITTVLFMNFQYLRLVGHGY